VIRRRVVLTPEAEFDLVELYDWIADRASSEVALSYVGRIEAYISAFDLASERGLRRDDIRSGLRVIGFEQRVTIAFIVDETTVTILRVFYGGRNWSDAFPS
jgi:toxin ParE1/3/4